MTAPWPNSVFTRQSASKTQMDFRRRSRQRRRPTRLPGCDHSQIRPDGTSELAIHPSRDRVGPEREKA